MPTPEQHALLSASSAERWSPIAGWEGLYEVSTCGRVKSLARQVSNNGGAQVVPEKILKPFLARGYCYVSLCRAGTPHKIAVHRLVGKAFMPNPENKREINHKDGDKTNNRVSNLEWVSSSENKAHRHRELMSPRSKSGVYGVEYVEKSGRWHVYTRIGGQKHIGCFSNKDDAVRAATEARNALLAAQKEGCSHV